MKYDRTASRSIMRNDVSYCVSYFVDTMPDDDGLHNLYQKVAGTSQISIGKYLNVGRSVI